MIVNKAKKLNLPTYVTNDFKAKSCYVTKEERYLLELKEARDIFGYDNTETLLLEREVAIFYRDEGKCRRQRNSLRR
jgi:hypothetical protein